MQKSNKPLKRCSWCGEDPLYIDYHDHEWGVPVYNDDKLFEFLVLEGAQAGLSWITILKKRDHYRKAFKSFDAHIVAKFSEKDVKKLLADPGIVRNRLKVQSAIKNAKAFIQIQQKYGSFSDYQWQFVDGKPIRNAYRSIKQVPTTTSISDKFSHDLKQKGFSFVGSTIIYAYMQAIGMVNDHLISCFRHQEI